MENAIIMNQKDAYTTILKEYPDILDVNQLSQLLSVSTKTAYGLLRSGKIKSMKVGRAFRVPKVHVLTYLGI